MAASTTSTHTFRRQNLLSNQAQAYVRESLPIIDLNAINDNHIMSTSFLEQVSAIDSVSFEVTGVTATRTLAVNFAHSTDGTTWSSYQPATLANLQLVAYNANNRCYFRWYFGRAGSDTSGIISVRALSLGYTYNPSANFGHGSFTSWGLTDEIFLFLKEIIASVSVREYNENKFDVLNYEVDQNSDSKKNTILVAGINTGQGSSSTISSDEYPCQCYLFIKMRGKNKGNNQGFATEAGYMRGTLLDIFRQRHWMDGRFTFTFKGVDFVAAPLSVLGMTDFKIRDMGVISVAGYDGTYAQLQLNFTIFAQRKI